MSVTRKAWIVAATSYGVDALKDQGICRLNYRLRYIKNNPTRSFDKAKVLSSPSLLWVAAASGKMKNEAKKPDKSIKKVMELGSWGPCTVRF
ncbi:hypothetical protein PTKIN_Ptkin14bG0096400 [Pterospermum kingtungense]